MAQICITTVKGLRAPITNPEGLIGTVFPLIADERINPPEGPNRGAGRDPKTGQAIYADGWWVDFDQAMEILQPIDPQLVAWFSCRRPQEGRLGIPKACATLVPQL